MTTAIFSVSRHAQQRRARLRESALSILFCAPAILLFGGFVVLPAILGFYYSFTDWTGWNSHAHFIGLENFKELLTDGKFYAAIRFTLFETVLIVLFFTFAAMVLAVLLDKLQHMKGLIRGLFFYPYILSILVCALLFMYMANYEYGLVNTILRSVQHSVGTLLHHAPGAGPDWAQDWMNVDLLPYFIFGLVAWNGLGFFSTLYLANLQAIPVELYEAATMDGAGPVAIFTKIQLPMLIPTITTNSVLALITGINLFSQIVVTTQGAYHTTTISYFIYRYGILEDRQGYAAAASFVMFAALVIISVIQIALLRRKEVSL